MKKIPKDTMNGIDKVQDEEGKIYSFFDWILWNKWFKKIDKCDKEAAK